MKPGGASLVFGVLALLFVGAASSSGQAIFFPSDRWSFFSPLTILLGATGLFFGYLAGRSRRQHEMRTQDIRDIKAQQILNSATAASILNNVQEPRAGRISNLGTSDILALGVYIIFVIITILISLRFPPIWLLTLLMGTALGCFFFPSRRNIYRWLGGLCIIPHILLGLALVISADSSLSILSGNPFVGLVYAAIASATALKILRSYQW